MRIWIHLLSCWKMVSEMWKELLAFVRFHPEVTVIGAFTIIQIAPIKVNPWSWVAGLIHRFLFGKIDEKLDAISGKVDKLEEQANEDKALQARTHILRFADELYNHIDHSKEYFDDILGDVDRYEKYCDEHPNFRNNKTVMSTQRIKDVYNKLLDEHRFL